MPGATRPLLAITMGDPAGIGPEVVLKTLAHPEVYARARLLVVGDRSTLERAAHWVEATDLRYDVVTRVEVGRYKPGVMTLMDQKWAGSTTRDSRVLR